MPNRSLMTSQRYAGQQRTLGIVQYAQFNFSSDHDKYSKQFENLVGKASKKLTKEEELEIERLEQQKMQQEEEASKQDAINQAKYNEQKQQDFEDLISGKKQAESEKNLQQLFTEFYSKAKSDVSKVDVKDYVNSAKASVGSLSSKLEARRQKIAQMKQEAFDLDKERKLKTEEDSKKKKSEDAKIDQTKDSAKASTDSTDK